MQTENIIYEYCYFLQGKKGEDSEENKLKLAALKTTSNINTLIRDIFRTPPSFKSKVQLSFQTKKVEKEVSFFFHRIPYGGSDPFQNSSNALQLGISLKSRKGKKLDEYIVPSD